MSPSRRPRRRPPDPLPRRRRLRAAWITTIVLVVLALEMGYTFLLLRTGSSPAAAVWTASALSSVTLGIVRGIIGLIRVARAIDDDEQTPDRPSTGADPLRAGRLEIDAPSGAVATSTGDA